MAKKKIVDDVIDIPQQEETVNTTVIEKKVKTPAKPEWEIKDRSYYLTGAHSPLTYTLASKHTSRFPLLWFDATLGEQKEIRYATNQNSVFVSEQKGEATLGHIIFQNGTSCCNFEVCHLIQKQLKQQVKKAKGGLQKY